MVLKKKYPDAIFISARNHIMIDKIKEAIYDNVCINQQVNKIKLPYNKSHLINKIYSRYNVLENISHDGFIELSVSSTVEELQNIKKMIGD